jgi:hypothetical protein
MGKADQNQRGLKKTTKEAQQKCFKNKTADRKSLQTTT